MNGIRWQKKGTKIEENKKRTRNCERMKEIEREKEKEKENKLKNKNHATHSTFDEMDWQEQRRQHAYDDDEEPKQFLRLANFHTQHTHTRRGS